MSERLPVLLSVPHAGLGVPPEIAEYHQLTPEQIAADGDVQAAEIYLPLQDEVQAFVTTDVARAFVDINRAADDIRKDGVIKTHTCWDVPIWRVPPPHAAFEALLERVHRPYHARLRELAGSGVIVGVDAHTMAAHGPPVGPDPGVERPVACIGIGDGTCPWPWAERLRELLEQGLGERVTINDPFRGGHVIRGHEDELPWLMIELSRTPALSVEAKRLAVARALRQWGGELRTPTGSLRAHP